MVSLARENMARDAMKLAGGHTYTVIDGPPHAESISRSCIVASDLVITTGKETQLSLKLQQRDGLTRPQNDGGVQLGSRTKGIEGGKYCESLTFL